MSNWKSEFGDDFVPSTEEALKANKPGVKQWSGRNSYLREDVKMLKTKIDTDYRVRFMPIPKHGHWAKQVRIHYNFGSGRGGSIGCPVMTGKPVADCPMCMKAKELYDLADKCNDKTEKDLLKTQAGRFAAKTYWLSFIIDRDNEKEGVQVLQYPETNYQTIVNRLKDKKSGKTRSIDDPEDGHDLFFTKRTEGGKDYAMMLDWDIDPDPSELGTDDQIKTYFTYTRGLGPIESLVTFKSKKEMLLVMNGSDDDDDDEEDGYDEKAEAKKAEAAPARRKRPDPEPDDDDSNDSSDDSGDETASKYVDTDNDGEAKDLRARLAARAEKRKAQAPDED